MTSYAFDIIIDISRVDYQPILMQAQYTQACALHRFWIKFI